MATKQKHIKAVIQLRRATEEQWYQVDPILHLGEPALSTDVNKLKIGDGTSFWSDLPYLTGEASGEQYTAGNGIIINNKVIALDDLILNCGTSTTNIGG